MRCRTSFLVMLMVVNAVLLAVSPASAADKSIAFGLPGPPTFGVEYEHGLSDSSSCCFTAGSFVIIFDFSVGLGMKWYKENSLMDGRYYGLSLYYGRGSFLGDHYFYSIQGVLGYKKVYNRLTVDVGAGPICFVENGDAKLLACLVLMVGWSLP